MQKSLLEYLFAVALCACGFMSSCSPRQRTVRMQNAIDCVSVASDSIHFTSGEEWMYGRVLDDSFNEYGYWVVLDEGADTLRIDIDLYCKLFNAERGGEDKFEVSGHVVGDSLVYTLSPTLSYECEGGRVSIMSSQELKSSHNFVRSRTIKRKPIRL